MRNEILAQITFGSYPKDAEESWCEQVELAFDGFMGDLPRRGQTLGDATHGVIEGELKTFVRLAAADALEERYISIYGRKHLTELETLFGLAPEIKILTSLAEVEAPADWRKAEWLVLYGAAVNGLAPVRNQEGECLPSYLFPIDTNEMERVWFWARSQDRHENIWFSSGSLEEEAFVALADPKSRLNLDAMELIGRLEKATGKPTYRYLFRHYALPQDAEENRACPGCGDSWKVSDEIFDFRCEPCRIVSNAGVAEDENDWASIGSWRGQGQLMR